MAYQKIDGVLPRVQPDVSHVIPVVGRCVLLDDRHILPIHRQCFPAVQTEGEGRGVGGKKLVSGSRGRTTVPQLVLPAVFDVQHEGCVEGSASLKAGAPIELQGAELRTAVVQNRLIRKVRGYRIFALDEDQSLVFLRKNRFDLLLRSNQGFLFRFLAGLIPPFPLLSPAEAGKKEKNSQENTKCVFMCFHNSSLCLYALYRYNTVPFRT